MIAWKKTLGAVLVSASDHVPFATGILAAGITGIAAAFSGSAHSQENEVLTVADRDTVLAVVLAPDRDPGPPGAGEAPIVMDVPEPITLPDLAARLEAATGRPVEIEERPARSSDGTWPLVTPPPVPVSYEGTLGGLLDLVAAQFRYRWEWRGQAIVFYRYWDAEFAANTAPPAPEEATWEIVRSEHGSLRAVFESWAGDAGWVLTWAANHDYSLAADARFTGTFLGAVDSVLADPATRGTLIATAYEANRQLVIEEVP